MKVLVTGASGYLGGRLCQVLIRRGFAVRAFVRSTSDCSSLQSNNACDGHLFEIFYGDVTDYHSLHSALSGCDAVFHSAALVEPWLPDPSKFFQVNVEGLKNVLHAFKEVASVKKIVYTSSFFALGPTDGYVADEKQVHPEKFFCTEYERSKTVADNIAMEEASNGLPIIILYPGILYGPGKMTAGNILARFLIERFSGRLPGYIGYGTDKESFSHVDDVAEGHILALQKGRDGERYLLTGENASLVNVFDIAAIITKTSRPRFHIPFWVIEAYGWISVFWAKFTGNIPLISYPVVNVLKHEWAYSCDKARVELGYNPRSLKEGLEEILPWLKELGQIKY